MSDDTTRAPAHDPARPAAAQAPAQHAPAKAPSLTDAEANRQLGQGGAPHAVDAPEASQEPEAATRATEGPAPAPAPVGGRTESGGAKQGEGTLYDRLAEKDRTPTEPGAESAIG